ncbi:hypothetical protein OTU49_016574 [Cherax quadricarinatus]|uniref:Endonuclease/exonuclease/phosphatase domain-containing protein n=1 Tax=Cherax quadricarinatus TaxID=27406 RepID=A0AAW0YBV7_CHEQU
MGGNEKGERNNPGSNGRTSTPPRNTCRRTPATTPPRQLNNPNQPSHTDPSVSTTRTTVTVLEQKLKVWYTNADGLTNKHEEWQERINEKSPDIIAVTETKLTETITDAIFPPGYQIMRKDRRGRGGGGVALLVKNRWKFEKMEGIDETGERDYIAGTLQSGEHKVVIAVMYNPPQNCRMPSEEYEESNRAMVDTLAEVARRAHSSRAKLLVIRNFNHREIDWENLEPHGGPETWRARMLDVVLENLMHQHVKDTTRVRGEDEPARLDLVFTLGSSDIEDIKYESPLGASDHVVLCFEYIVELQVERITGVEWEKPD